MKHKRENQLNNKLIKIGSFYAITPPIYQVVLITLREIKGDVQDLWIPEKGIIPFFIISHLVLFYECFTIYSLHNS